MKNKSRAVLDSKSFYNTADSLLHYRTRKSLFDHERIAFDHIPGSSTLLDLGCGTGRTTAHLIERGHKVVALDLSVGMIETAKAENRDIPYSVGDASALSFKDGQFDGVVFSFNGIDCLHPYDKRLKALREIHRVLRPGGLFIFSAHNNCIPRDLNGVIPFIKTLFKKTRSTYMLDRAYAWSGIKTYLTTPTSQVRELEKSGFRLLALIPKKKYLRKAKSLRLIGLIDTWVYYVTKTFPIL